MDHTVTANRRILIVNAHSARNLGDDAILRATLQHLERRFPNAAITLAANDPESWHRHKTLSAVPSLCTWAADCKLGNYRRHFWRMALVLLWLALAGLLFRLTGHRLLMGAGAHRELITAYYDADLILSGGGGNLYAHRSPSPALFWALMAPAFGLVLGKPVYLLPQSIGPIAGRGQRALARLVLNRVDRVMVRESISLAFCREQLNLHTSLELFPDLAFGLESDLQPVERSTAVQIGVTVIDRGAQNSQFQKQAAYEEAVADALAALHRENDAQITIFVQAYGPSPDQDDRPVARRLANRLDALGIQVIIRDDFVDPCSLQQAYSQMDAVIATRMHTAILALGAMTPAVAISYQPKARGMMGDFGLPGYQLDISEAKAQRLQEMVQAILRERETLRAGIQQQLAVVRMQLASWVDLLDG